MILRAVALIVTCVLLLAPVAAHAQQAAKISRIGVLGRETPPVEYLEAFRVGLSALGYVEGQNIAIEYRWAAGRADQLVDLAADLVRLKVDLIVAMFAPAARAAKQATATIPIVMVGVADPVGVDLVARLARPGGNTFPDLTGKRLQLLREVTPNASPVAHPLESRQSGHHPRCHGNGGCGTDLGRDAPLPASARAKRLRKRVLLYDQGA